MSNPGPPAPTAALPRVGFVSLGCAERIRPRLIDGFGRMRRPGIRRCRIIPLLAEKLEVQPRGQAGTCPGVSVMAVIRDGIKAFGSEFTKPRYRAVN